VDFKVGTDVSEEHIDAIFRQYVLRNVGTYLQVHTALQSRRLTLTIRSVVCFKVIHLATGTQSRINPHVVLSDNNNVSNNIRMHNMLCTYNLHYDGRTRRFKTANTNTRLWTRTRASSFNRPATQLISIRFISMLSSHLLVGLANGRFPKGFVTKM
jgi:hypothetical protein